MTDKSKEVVKLEKIMEQAQVFASAWSLVGGRFDNGNMLDEAEAAKKELRQMVAEALAEQPAPEDSSVAEPIYQCQDSNGKWTDQEKHSYDYNVKHGHATVRVVYLAPQPAQRTPPDVIKAAQGVLEFTEIAHRPPVRDQLEVGRMVMVRLHALADLHNALTAQNIKEQP